MSELSAEDAKLVTLARATRARTGAAEGAAVRDLDGRTYAGATVVAALAGHLGPRRLPGHGRVLGARGLEAAVVLGGSGSLAEPTPPPSPTSPAPTSSST